MARRRRAWRRPVDTTTPLGIVCPVCGGDQWRVLEVRGERGYIRRRHECGLETCVDEHGRRTRWTVDVQRATIEVWCMFHLGAVLPITATKDYFMSELWDDRCVRVERNVGEPVVGCDVGGGYG